LPLTCLTDTRNPRRRFFLQLTTKTLTEIPEAAYRPVPQMTR
jgi:hypothetical protein